MARLFSCGFELNSITDGVEISSNSAPVSIVTTPVRSGTYSGRVNAGVGFWRQLPFTSDQNIVGYIGVAVYVAAAPNASTQLVRFSTAANAMVGNITMTTSRTLVLLTSAGVQLGSATAALSLNTWYYVELKIDATTATGTLEGRLNGSVFASGNNAIRGSWARCLVGNVTGAQTTNDMYFDDWKINDASGSAQTGYPGSGSLIIMRPDAQGDSNQWLQTAGAPAGSNNYTMSNEVTPNDSTNYIQSSTVSDVDMYNVSASGTGSADTIACVQVGVRFVNTIAADATSAFKIQIEKAASGTKLQSVAIIPNSTTWRTNTTAAPDTYRLTAYTDPDGAAWTGGTSGTLDSMQIGATITAFGTRSIAMSTIWAYVDVIAGVITQRVFLIT